VLGGGKTANFSGGQSNGSRSADSIEWQASEYVQHDKGAGWVFILTVVALLGVGAALWFGQWMFAFLLGVMAVAFGYYAVRKPRIMHYQLSNDGLKINGKPFPITDFRAFGVIDDGALYSIRLIPAKRLAPAIMIYFAEDDGETIVDILGRHMPMEQMHPDIMDVIMRKLRF